MSSLRDNTRFIAHALNQSLKLVESDTEASTIDLNLLGNLNTNQSLNYIKLEHQLNAMEKDSEKMKALEEEFGLIQGDMDQLEKQVQVLTSLTGELDEWSKEVKEKVMSR